MSGTQQFAAVGYDFDSGLHRLCGSCSKTVNERYFRCSKREVYGFAGVSVDVSATKNDFFNHDTLLTAKGGCKKALNLRMSLFLH